MHRPALTRLLVFAGVALHAATASAQEAVPLPEPDPPAPTPTPYGPSPRPPEPALVADKDAIFKDGAIPNDQVSVLLHASVGADWLRQVPRLSLDAVSPERTIAPQTLPSAGPLAMWRAQAGLDVVVSRRWIVPLFAMAVGAAIGPSDRVVTAADGSFIQMRPWTTGMMTFLGPGAGVRFTNRRWTLSGDVRGVISYVWMRADVVSGGTINGDTISAWVPALRADLQACRRVGPLDHACVYVEARAYETTFFNGGSLGLRWEFGG